MPNTNWRSRRLNACRAIGDLRNVIEALGEDDGTLSGLDLKHNRTSSGMKQVLKEQADLLLRQILMFNDGNPV